MKDKFDREALYRRTPIVLQNLLASAYGWLAKHRRFGGGYATMEAAIIARRGLTGSELIALQRERLGRHLAASATTEFWRGQFARYGVDPAASDPFAELAKLPVLEKSTTKENVRTLINPTVPAGQLARVHTSGTTGSGLIFWETRESERERWAIWWRYRSDLGINHSERCGYLGGRSVVPVKQTRPPYWRYNLPGRQILFSGYHLSERSVADYWAELQRSRVRWIHGYPSMLNALAELAEGAGLSRLPNLRWITIGAENLLDSQRVRIERVLGCPVHQHYGMAESVANISEWADGRMHVDEDFSFVEFVPVDGMPGVHRIIGTNWSNPAFPLLRYDTGDLATLPSGISPTPDGSWRAVDSVDGRQEDTVVLPSGARIGRLDHIFKDLIAIREAQIVQTARGGLVFRIVRGREYGSEDEIRLLREARVRLGQEIAIEVDYVTELPRTAAGKLRFVVSDMINKSVS